MGVCLVLPGSPHRYYLRRRTFRRTCLLPNFAKAVSVQTMTTMNISLPEVLKSFVDDQVGARGYSTSSEYIRELIRKDQDRQRLRRLLLDGAASPPTTTADADYFDGLRDVVRQARRR